MLTVTGKLESILAGAAELGTVVLKLHGYGQQVPRVSGTAMLGRTAAATIQAGADGAWSAQLYGNDQITPPGTYYTVTVLDSNGTTIQVNAYQFVGPQSSFDLSSFPPFDPTGSLVAAIPANQMVTVAWSPAPQFDGTAGLTFDFTLQSAVASSFLNNPVPGNLYTFILTQPVIPTGFAWPGTFTGGSLLSPVGGSVTIQTFVCRADQTCDAIAPAMYYTPSA